MGDYSVNAPYCSGNCRLCADGNRSGTEIAHDNAEKGEIVSEFHRCVAYGTIKGYLLLPTGFFAVDAVDWVERAQSTVRVCTLNLLGLSAS